MLHELTGDATLPVGEGPRIVAHVCNDVGRWGDGFALAVSQRWPKARSAFRRWFRTPDFALGELQLVPVGEDLWVAHMVAQHGLRSRREPRPLRGPALRKCLRALRHEAEQRGAEVHMPRIGCGRAGGDWPTVEAMIREELAEHVEVFVYRRTGEGPDAGSPNPPPCC